MLKIETVGEDVEEGEENNGSTDPFVMNHVIVKETSERRRTFI